MSHTLKFVVILLTSLTLLSCAPVEQGGKQTDQHQAETHYKLAMAHLQAKNPTLALKELLISERKEPNNSKYLVALAQTYQQKKAYSLAEEKYLKALKYSNNDPRYQNNIATLYLDTEEWDKAIHYFDLASKNLLFAKAHVAIAGKAYAYYRKMDYPNALKYVDDAISLAPNYAQAYLLKSEIYKAMGDAEHEKFYLQRTVDVAPYFIGARYKLAETLLKENSLVEARQQLQTIVDYSPNSEVGRKAEALLKTITH